ALALRFRSSHHFAAPSRANIGIKGTLVDNDGPAACLGAPFARYRGREVGGGRATRQPGQVRKEAALTSSGSGRSSASHSRSEWRSQEDHASRPRVGTWWPRVAMNDARAPADDQEPGLALGL